MKAAVVIDAAQVVQVYNGRPGCACGCRGTYSETSRSIATTLRKLAAADPLTVEYTEGFDGIGIYYWDSRDTRTHSIQFKLPSSK